MKKLKHYKKIIIFLSIILTIGFGITYSTWQAGGGINWIADPDNTSRFTEVLIDGIPAYKDSFTDKYWEKTPTGGPMQWAIDKNYTEPTWNGTDSYIYPSGRTIVDYPAFAHCDNKGGGWRLPTKKEFESIISYTEKNSSNYHTKLKYLSSATYWSSTAYSISTNRYYAWYFYLEQSRMGRYYKDNTTFDKFIVCIHD